MGILNFAHGAIYMVAGYICYQFSVELGLNQWISLILSVVIVGLFGLFLEKFCFRPFLKDWFRAVVMTIAVTLIIETTVNVTVGVYTRQLPLFIPGVFKAGAISVSAERILTFIAGGVLLLLLTWFIRKAKMGQQMLAIAQNSEGAAFQGIDINRVSAIACVMGCALAAIAGCLMGALFQLSPYAGDSMLLKAIQIVILSGIGSFGGIVFAGLIIGFIDAILPLLTSGAITQTVGVGIIIVLLLVRPQGFFGREV